MSNNTNTLFWVITGAVIVLGVFLLINNSQTESLSNINNKYSGLFEQANASPEIIEYYNHEQNYGALKITNEENFIFDETTGTITGYIGTDTNVVFPYQINGVKVKKIDDMNLWNNYLYSQDCPYILNASPDDYWARDQLDYFIDMGIIKDGQCQTRVLLDSVVIPNCVEELGNGAFNYNRNLKNVILPSSIKKIGTQAFHENQLESIDLSKLKDLTYIGTYAFAYNNISGEVVIPDSVTKMDYYAFGDNNISHATVSKNLDKLPMFTFTNNPNMEYVIFRNDNMELRELINGVDKTFTQDSDFIVYIPQGSKDWYKQFPALNNYKIIEVEE